jgi:hypothetical protein
VRAGVVEDAPLAGTAVVPGDDAEAKNRLAVRRAGVEVAHGAKGYHWSSQSNRSCPDGDGDSVSSVRASRPPRRTPTAAGCRARPRGSRPGGAAAEEGGAERAALEPEEEGEGAPSAQRWSRTRGGRCASRLRGEGVGAARDGTVARERGGRRIGKEVVRRPDRTTRCFC